LESDATFRREALEDVRLHGLLRSADRVEQSGEIFASSIGTYLAKERDGADFVKKVERGISEGKASPDPRVLTSDVRSSRRFTRRQRGTPGRPSRRLILGMGVAAAGILAAAILFASLSTSKTKSLVGGNADALRGGPREEVTQGQGRLEAERAIPEEEDLRRTEADRKRAEIKRPRKPLEERTAPPGEEPPSSEERRKEDLVRPEREPKRLKPELRGAGEKEERSRANPAEIRKPPRPTVTSIARVERLKGEVYVVSGDTAPRSRATEGQILALGQGVLTEGAESSASVTQADGTRLTLGTETQILYEDGRRPEVFLGRGRLDVEANARTSGEELAFATPHADVRFVGARFTLTAGPASTRIDVLQGAAEFINPSGKAVEVKAGNCAVAQASPEVDLKRVDAAIHRGLEFLRKANSQGMEVFSIPNCDELILFTLLQAGVSKKDPVFQKYLKNMTSTPLLRTYSVALQAMALEELDRVKYQGRIYECAQFLVDTQCVNGQWTYGGPPPVLDPLPNPPVGSTPSERPKKDAAPDKRMKPKVVQTIPVKRTRSGPDEGDNSNSQYAALGLRACGDAGLIIPKETLVRAADWLRKAQHADKKGAAVATGEGGLSRGWCYFDGKGMVNGQSCLTICPEPIYSMTLGSVGSLVIYDSLLDIDWKKDASIRSGINWITDHFMVHGNPGITQMKPAPLDTYLYYSLYALERAGVFCATETFGRHEWYREGANFILGKQRADGSWLEPTPSNHAVWDTCFAILFLKRATRPIDVASVDRVLESPK
jgi:hypothetical protein